jgi:hypothetical protein
VCRASPGATLLCGGCMAVRYCSRECQKVHWKAHRKACKELQAAGLDTAVGAAAGIVLGAQVQRA